MKDEEWRYSPVIQLNEDLIEDLQFQTDFNQTFLTTLTVSLIVQLLSRYIPDSTVFFILNRLWVK